MKNCRAYCHGKFGLVRHRRAIPLDAELRKDGIEMIAPSRAFVRRSALITTKAWLRAKT
jgi:hypothetical protein